jgi:ATP-dependent protease ClpP protease subunit
MAVDTKAPGQAPPDLPSLLLDGRICYIGMAVSQRPRPEPELPAGVRAARQRACGAAACVPSYMSRPLPAAASAATQLVPAVTELIISELLWLNYAAPEKPIYLYINSSGAHARGMHASAAAGATHQLAMLTPARPPAPPASWQCALQLGCWPRPPAGDAPASPARAGACPPAHAATRASLPAPPAPPPAAAGSQTAMGEAVAFDTEATAILDTMAYVRPEIYTLVRSPAPMWAMSALHVPCGSTRAGPCLSASRAPPMPSNGELDAAARLLHQPARRAVVRAQRPAPTRTAATPSPPLPCVTAAGHRPGAGQRCHAAGRRQEGLPLLAAQLSHHDLPAATQQVLAPARWTAAASRRRPSNRLPSAISPLPPAFIFESCPQPPAAHRFSCGQVARLTPTPPGQVVWFNQQHDDQGQ